MDSDSDQSPAPSTIDGYFQKQASVGSVPARRTRNFSNKRPVVPPKSKKLSQAPTHSARQRSAIEPPSAKRKKITDTIQNTPPVDDDREENDREENDREENDHEENNHEENNYEENDQEDSFSDTEFQTAFDDESEKVPTPISVSQVSSSKQSTAKQRPFTSRIHEHFTFITDPKTGLKRYKCKHCPTTYAFDSGTTTSKNHLKKEHKIDVMSRDLLKQAVYNENISLALSRQPAVDEDRKQRLLLEHQTRSIDKKTLQYLYIRWIITADISFSQAKNEDFRPLLQYINAPANALIPRSASTIQLRVLELFSEGKKRVQIILRNAVSSIHITCDAWTSPNHLGMLAIVAHFADENMQQQTLLLSLNEIQGPHTGENMAQAVLRTLDDYEIRNSLGYFVMDNAENNDTMLKCVSRAFREQHGIEYDPVEHRLRCSGHIINLSVQAFLFGKHPTAEHLIIIDIPAARELDKELQEFRKLGPQGKLHNINTYIMRTPQRIQRFKALSNGLMPKRDQAVRWNAWYMMMDWSLNKIKSAIHSFVSDEPELEVDSLSATDWRLLTQMRDFLRSFYEVTKATEGREATIERVLPMFDFLLHRFEIEAAKYEPNSFMALSVHSGYLKLVKYWKLIVERAPIYLAAVVLDPSQKWDYFSHWDADQLNEAKLSLANLWNKYNYSPASTVAVPTTTEEASEIPEFRRWMARTRPAVVPVDELQQYLLEPKVNNLGNVISWWKTQRERLPLLTRMAMDVYSIPSMSSEPERVFSGAKHTISDARASLKPDTIEALECCKSMLRVGAFTDAEISAAMAAELEELEELEE